MKANFYAVADSLASSLPSELYFGLYFVGEKTHFTRFNHGKIRQSGSVQDGQYQLQLTQGDRQTVGIITATHHLESDLRQLKTLAANLQAELAKAPPYPYVALPESVNNSERDDTNQLPDAEEMIEDVVGLATGLDLVGILTSGSMVDGFANSQGQRNWCQTHSYSVDWSTYSHADKAIKEHLAGFHWDREAMAEKLSQTRANLPRLKNPAKKLTPGSYRVFLSPTAMKSLVGVLAGRSFGLKNIKTKRSPLLKLATGEEKLNPKVNLIDAIGSGLTPPFSPRWVPHARRNQTGHSRCV